MATTNYSGANGGAYEAARRGIEQKYTTDAATNAYGRFLSQQRGQRGLSDMTDTFKRQYAPYRSSFAARGLSGGNVTSGVTQNAMRNYVGDYYREFGRGQQDLAQNLQQYDLGQAQLDSWRQDELSNLQLRQAQEIASAAQNLEALRAYLGGI